MHTYIHTCIRTYMHTFMHTHTGAGSGPATSCGVSSGGRAAYDASATSPVQLALDCPRPFEPARGLI